MMLQCVQANGYKRKRALVLAAALSVVSLCAFSQSSSLPAPLPGEELQSRLQDAAEAQQSGIPGAVENANKRVLAFTLARMAELRARQGAASIAIELYKRSNGFEDTPSTHLGLALAYHKAGRTEDALRECTTVTQLDPKDAFAWNLQGKLLMMKKDYQQAADALGKSLSLRNDMEAAYTLAAVLLQLRETDKAGDIFKRMETVAPVPAEIHVLAGRAYENAKLLAEAEGEYKKAIQLNAKASHGHYYLGLFYLTQNGWEVTPQARQEFLAEVAENPTDFFGNYFMGYITSTEKAYKESDAYLKVAAAAKPDWPEPYLYMGLNAYGDGYNAVAEKMLRKAIELTGKDEVRNDYQIRRAYFTLGRILIQNGNREEGTRYIQRSREMETKLVINARQQALTTRDATTASSSAAILEPATAPPTTADSVDDPAAPLAGDLPELGPAEKAQAIAMEQQLRPIIASAFNDLGTAEARRKDYGLAMAHFQDAERWRPDTPGLMRNIGLAAFFSKNYSASARAFKTVVAQNPQDRLAQSMLAMSLFSTNNYSEAAKAFESVQDAALADPRMAYSWALSLARINDRPRASAILDKLTAQSVPAEMLAPACQLYADIGEQAKAQACLQKQKEPPPTR